MIRKEKIVSYVDGHTIDGDVLVPTFKEEKIMLTGTKRFHNCLHLILGLGKMERLLIDWITEEMDERNIIRNEIYVRKMFIDFIEKLNLEGKGKTYTDGAVNNSFGILRKKGILTAISKGVMQVNPKYYWNSSDSDRIDAIMMNIQFSTTSANFKILPIDNSKKKK